MSLEHVHGAEARIVTVPDQAAALFHRAALKLPEHGPFNLHDLAERSATSRLNLSERFAAKTHLQNAGLPVQ